MITAAIVVIILLLSFTGSSYLAYRDKRKSIEYTKVQSEYFDKCTQFLKHKPPTPMFKLDSSKRKWLEKIQSVVDSKYDGIINKILKEGYYTPTQQRALNNIRESYIDIIGSDD